MSHHLHNYAAAYVEYDNVSRDDINSEKYSLRQRQRSRKSACLNSNEILQQQQPNNVGNIKANSLGKKRLLNRYEAALGTVNKTKTKAAPLSKYRRKTANARERSRMREINSAFESLRQCVPPEIAEEDVGCANEKLTKITTLRLAMKYISKLTEALEESNFDSEFLLQKKKNYSSLDDAKTVLDDCVSSKTNKYKINSQTVQPIKKKSLSKSSGRKQLNKLERSKTKPVYRKLDTALTGRRTTATNISPVNFESDGESLHLSETSFSPMDDTSDELSTDSVNTERNVDVRLLDQNTNLNYCVYKSPIRNPFEISLCVLDSANESLDFATDHQPLLCSSPFPTLESLNPFTDLLQNDFAEHNSLDLFLT